MKEQKSDILRDAFDAAYSADCSEGLTGYRTAALDSLQSDVEDEAVSVDTFSEKVSDILRR